MPNPHFDVQIISRGGNRRGGRSSSVASSAYRSGTVVSALAAASMMLGSSAVASASYRSGEALYDMRAEKTFDYRAKEDVVHTEILTPDHAPVWASDRQMLWNQVELVEKRKDAQLARDVIAALPRELDARQQIALVRDFVQTQFVAHGMIADIAIHDKVASDGGRQPHAHIMLTLRNVSPAGFAKKNREWNKRTMVGAWRDAWEEATNRHLAAAGRSERVSLRSYEEQGIDKEPGEHMGPQKLHTERKGKETRRGNRNRETAHRNEVMERLRRLLRRKQAADRNAMLDTMQQEARRVDAPLLASSMAEEADANRTEGNQDGRGSADPRSPEHASWPSQQDEAGSKTNGYTDAQLEAMHWASVRRAVRGMMRQPVQAVAEQMQRLRRYGQDLIARSGQVARSVFDRYGSSRQRPADRAGSQLASRARQEEQRNRHTRAREDPER